MARITSTIDDLTGATLTEDVEPTVITVDGTKYELDLGSASKDRLVKWLSGEGSITTPPKTNGQTTPRPGTETGDTPPSNLPSGTKSKYAAAKKDQMDTFRQWAKIKGIELAEKGAPKNTVVEDFFADNPGLTRLIGRETVSVEDWHAAQ